MHGLVKEKMQSILDFAFHLNQKLQKDFSADSEPSSELTTYLAALPIPYTDFSSTQRIVTRKCAAEIWNNVNSTDVEGLSDIVAAKVSAFAYLLLDSTTKHNKSVILKHIANHGPSGAELGSDFETTHFRNGVKVARRCINAKDLDLAYTIIGLVSKRYESLLHVRSGMKTSAQLGGDMIADYMCLRIVLDWKRERLDLAENWYSQLVERTDTVEGLSQSTHENLLDVLYEIGSSQLSKQQAESAAAWLQKARSLLNSTHNTASDTDVSNLRLNISHAYVRALSVQEDPCQSIIIGDVLLELKHEHGHKLAVMVLEMEIYKDDLNNNVHAYVEALQRMMKAAHVIENNHKTILYFVSKLCVVSAGHALDCLRSYIVQRLIPHGNDEWTQNAIVLVVRTLTSSPELTASEIVNVIDTLSSIQRAWNNSLSTEAAQGSHMMIWKQIEEQGYCKKTLEYCRLALHSVFERSGDENLGKIERKLIACHINASGFEAAQGVIQRMPESRRFHYLTQLLRYKLALSTGDDTEARAMLNIVLKESKGNKDLIFAYVEETANHGNKADCARLFQRVVDKFVDNCPPDLDMIVLLRSTTRLLITIIEESLMPQDELLTRLRAILKITARLNTSKPSLGSVPTTGLPPLECQWFQRASYNIAVQNLKTWPHKHIIDILEYSSQMRCSLDEASYRPPPAIDTSDHEENIIYLQTILYTSIARNYRTSWTSADIPSTAYNSRTRPADHEVQRCLYKNIFDRFIRLRQAYDRRQTLPVTEEAEQMSSRVGNLIPLAFEALLFLNIDSTVQQETEPKMDELSLFHLIETSVRLDVPTKVYAVMADIVLCSVLQCNVQGPSTRTLPFPLATRLLAKIVAAIQRTDAYDLNQAARWIRCIVQLVVEYNDEINGEDTSSSSVGKRAMLTMSEDAKLKLLSSLTDQALQLACDITSAGHDDQEASHSVTDYEGDTTMADFGTEIEIRGKQSLTSPSNMIKTSVYPPQELQYLATILFNKAIDIFVAENEDLAKSWAAKAVQVAECFDRAQRIEHYTSHGVNDGIGTRSFAKVLRSKMRELNWEC